VSVVALILTALVGGEAIPAILAAIGVGGRAATAITIGAKALPTVFEGLRKLRQRPDLSAEEVAVLEVFQQRRVRDLGGPMDKFA
jgi:hypothetical protein